MAEETAKPKQTFIWRVRWKRRGNRMRYRDFRDQQAARDHFDLLSLDEDELECWNQRYRDAGVPGNCENCPVCIKDYGHDPGLVEQVWLIKQEVSEWSTVEEARPRMIEEGDP